MKKLKLIFTMAFTIFYLSNMPVYADLSPVLEPHLLAATSKNSPKEEHFIKAINITGAEHDMMASQFYLYVENNKPKTCFPTGCSGQICSDTEVSSTCEWLPEYACYRNATCSIQKNGNCGWVMDEELQRCLDDSTNEILLQPGMTK